MVLTIKTKKLLAQLDLVIEIFAKLHLVAMMALSCRGKLLKFAVAAVCLIGQFY